MQRGSFFENGLHDVFVNLRTIQHKSYPTTIYYAYKQREEEALEDEVDTVEREITSTGWESVLNSLVESGFTINGTWPIRT